MRAVLDANVFYSTWVTDVLLSFADADLYEPAWSDRIMGEVRNHLPHVWSRATQEGVDKYLAILDRAFPEASVCAGPKAPPVTMSWRPRSKPARMSSSPPTSRISPPRHSTP